MNKKKTINVFNTLIEINQDRIEGYQIASKETDECDLKGLFAKLIDASEECKSELVAEVFLLGGKPEEGTQDTGKFFRIWMDIKAALSGNDRKTILDSCDFGEYVVIDTYKRALENYSDDLTYDHSALIRRQYRIIKDNHDEVRLMRDELHSVQSIPNGK